MTLGRRPVLWLLAVLGLLDGAGTVRAQDAVKPEAATPEKVRFHTADGVVIQGSYYASKKRKAPVVMLLHALGEDSRTKEWTSLAEELQQAGLNVLSFDFRGHGQSTEVDPDVFWAVAVNQAGVKEIKDARDQIDFKNIDKRYYPVLANDIAAAKAYLDRVKNDDGSCNTSSVILIGAETGATLGAIWMTAEWSRYRHNPATTVGMASVPESQPQGKDVICGFWLSISPTLGSRQIRLDTLLAVPVKRHATPMVFMFSDGDVKGKAVSRACEKALKVADKRHRFITAVEIKGNKLTGSNLLQPSLGTAKAIVDYLEQVCDAKSNEWFERNYRKSEIFWHYSNGSGMRDQILPSKPAWESVPLLDTYEKFLP